MNKVDLSFLPLLPSAQQALQKGQPRFDLDELAGRLTELSGQGASAALSLAMHLVFDVQRRGEPVAWITSIESCFFPPDVAACGIDLDSLVVVRVPDVSKIPRAAELSARSGAFGLVVMDLGLHASVPMPMQSRLLGLAQKHTMAIVCLTEKPGDAPSLGSLVSLRGEARVERAALGFLCRFHADKDKRRSPGWTYEEVFRGPAGLY